MSDEYNNYYTYDILNLCKVPILSEEGGTLRIRLDESVKNKFYSENNLSSCWHPFFVRISFRLQ